MLIQVLPRKLPKAATTMRILVHAAAGEDELTSLLTNLEMVIATETRVADAQNLPGKTKKAMNSAQKHEQPTQ